MNHSPLEFHNTDENQKDSEIEKKLPVEYLKDEEEELIAKARLKIIRNIVTYLEIKNVTLNDCKKIKLDIDIYNTINTSNIHNNK